MPENLNIDEKLIEEARSVGKHKTKEATITEALEEYILRRKQISVLNFWGKIDYDSNYDYKRQRQNR